MPRFVLRTLRADLRLEIGCWSINQCRVRHARGLGSFKMRAYVAWFDRGDSDEIKRSSADLQDTFDEWLASAEAGVKGAAAQGIIVEKVVLTPGDLRQRQRATGRKVDAKGRANLAVANGIEADKRRTRH
jgi:hypothetical protein